MTTRGIREWTGALINIRKVKEHFEDVEVFPVMVPELRCTRLGMRGKSVPNVVVTQSRIHAEIAVGNLENRFLQRKARVHAVEIDERARAQQLNHESLSAHGVVVICLCSS